MNTALQAPGPTGKPSSDDWSDDRLDLSADRAGRHAGWGVVAVLAGVCLVLRVTRLTALPIFGDEAIYLRWTQLIRLNPWANAFISLDDPKPPLHYWLMAMVYRWGADPLWSGRFLSVLAAVGTVFALAGVCREMGRLLVDRADAEDTPAIATWVPIVLLLAIFCPYLAFYQRMALAESLFALEMCGIVWLTLRWVRAIQQDAPAGTIVLLTVFLGGAFGVCFLTRQNMSYVLIGMVPAAWVLGALGAGDGSWRSAILRRSGWGAALLAFALLLAGIMWLPFLLERQDLFADRSVAAELKRRILYQDQFTQPMPLGARIGLVADNLRRAFVPWNVDKHAWQMNAGWFWVNLSPGIFLLVFAAAGWMAWRRQYRLLIFLVVWSALLLGPLLLLGTVPRSRYALPACVPMLIAVGYLAADQATRLFALGRKRIAPAIWLAAICGAMLLAAGQVGLQVFSPYNVLATDAENYEYRTGWTAGRATESAIAALRRDVASNGVVITTSGWGPTDALWVYLDPRDPGNARHRGVKQSTAATTHAGPRLFYVDDFLTQPLLRGAGTDRYLLKNDKWLYPPEQPVTITPDQPIYFVCPVPVHTSHGDVNPDPVLRRLNRIDGPAVRFDNPPDKDGISEGVEIFILRTPTKDGK